MWAVAFEISQRSGGDPGHPGLFGQTVLAPALEPTRLIVMQSEGWAMTDPATMAAFTRLLSNIEAHGVTIVRRQDSKLLDAFEHAIANSLALCRGICGYELR